LKCFSLTCYCLSNEYDREIRLLFSRMSNLKELTLHVIINQRNSFIDGNHINNEILIHMPQLDRFKFCISTTIQRNQLIENLSKDDIQQTFSKISYKQVECIINCRYRLINYYQMKQIFIIMKCIQ
jgi:hypothetical protein